MPRLTVEFPDKVNDILTNLAEAEETTKVEVIRRALALYDYLHKQGIRQGGDRKISITDNQDQILKDIVF